MCFWDVKPIQFSSVPQLFLTLRPHRLQPTQPSLSFTISQSLPKLMSIESLMPSNHLALCHPLLLLPSVFPSIRGFFLVSWLFTSVGQILELQLQHQSFQRIFRTISFRVDWLDLLTVQGTLKSLVQYHSSKASILWHSAFFVVHTWLLEKP